jgi:EAL domain-containing protein (putative c-di-GMP-specific phosphodiesterase class I)
MRIFDKANQTSHLFIVIFSMATLFSICTFFWLGLEERTFIKEMRQIIYSDIGSISGVSREEKVPLQIQSHLTKDIQTSHIIYTVIILSVLFLGLAWFIIFMHLRRLKKLKMNEQQQQLEELLYYNQVNEIHETSPVKEQIPASIKEIQLDRNAFIAELQLGLKQNQFILHYQPIVNALDGKIMAVEALIRWQHPIHGLLQPNAFLPLCENTGFIIPLGEWVLKTACQQIKQWQKIGYSQLGISINLSTLQLNDSRLLQSITDILSANDLSPDSLNVEISENSLMKDVNASAAILRSMSHLGLQISLDDFGTGYSSLQYLKQLPISHLKIDKFFISDMSTNITSFGIVESILALGKSLGLTITAEGVENEHQSHILKKMGCDLFQGYFYSKPVSADELSKLLHAEENIYSKNAHGLTNEKNRYRYDVLKKEHYDQAVNLISDSFCETHPMTKYLGITPIEFTPFARMIVTKAISDGLSMVALDNDKVSACTIVEDIANPLNIPIDTDSRFKIIVSLFDNLGSDFFNERAMYKGHIAHLFMTAVDKRFHGHGLSRKINFESIRLAREKNFDFMCCEFTHDSNEKGTVNQLRNNKLLIRSQQYKDFTFNGIKPFENLEGYASAYIWELREGAKLRYKINTIIGDN